MLQLVGALIAATMVAHMQLTADADNADIMGVSMLKIATVLSVNNLGEINL